MKSADWFENQLVEFLNNLTIKVVFFKRELWRLFLSAKNFWNLWNSLSLSLSWSYSVQLLKIDLGSFLEHFCFMFEAWRRWFWKVRLYYHWGLIFLKLLGCAWWFSMSARSVLLCWFDSCVIQESLCGGLAYFESLVL